MAQQRNLNEQAEAIMIKAKKCGMENNLFFLTSFSDFQNMRKTLINLKKSIDENGTFIDGKINPCISEYSRIATAAANLGKTIMQLLNENS